jgi:hypothetical protein
MILTKITFGHNQARHRSELEDLAEVYLGSLFHTGQLNHEYLMAWVENLLTAYVKTAGPSALQSRHHSKLSKGYLKELDDAFGRQPSWEAVENDKTLKEPTWKIAPFFYLFTHAFHWGPAIHRGKTVRQLVGFSMRQQPHTSRIFNESMRRSM